MDLALIASAALLGLAGAPHCAAMCGASCAAVVGSCGGREPTPRAVSFHLARGLGYATAGALLAAGVGLLALAGSAAPVIRPLWSLLHMAALALGLWLLFTGRQPEFMTRLGRQRSTELAPAAVAGGGGWKLMQTPWSAAAAGSVWVAWPCGLLQSALVVAGLANTPQVGAAAMAAFAATSALGLHAVPVLARYAGRSGGRAVSWAVRLAGLALVLGSGWAVGHDLWGQIVAYCAT
ncbi:MAG: sulfite exporter TauE/SafE family protein [Rubrivivax sp.]|nr:sulfite exporter TauE/SafE family protein [Rubrivivax sp.]